jgi:serine/threonine protein kinase
MGGKHDSTWVSPEKEPPHKKQDSGPSPSPKKLRITIRKPPPSSFSSATATNDVTSCDDVSGTNSSNNDHNNKDDNKKRPPPVTIHDLFDIQKLIGEGGFGKVYLAIRRRDMFAVALKAIPVSLPDFEETLKREVEALSALSDPGHPNVCKLYDQLRDNLHSYLSMEYIGGGELFEHLCDSGPFSEKDAAKFLRQFANGLHYIHSKGYIHSDLKPENLMMGYSWGQQADNDNNDNDNNNNNNNDTKNAAQQQQQQLKVVDFGFSVPDQESVKLHFHGTVAYLPPECLHKKSSPRHPTAAGDMFAVGVIIYTVLTGTHPFDRTNQAPDSIIAQAIVQSAGSTFDDNDDSNNNNNNNNKSNDNDNDNNEYLNKHVFDDRTQGLSSSSLSLMRSLLHPDPNRRMTSLQLCSHPWILGQTATKHSLSTCSHSKLKSFWQRRFRAAIMKKFVSCSNNNNNNGGALSTKEYKVIFQSMDLDGNGLVTLDELKRCMSESFGTKQSISDIFSSVDEDGSGGIDFDEFERIMRKKFDGSDGNSNYNSCDDDDDGNNNKKKAASEKISAISNEQVRACIFQKFGGTGTTKGTTTSATTNTTTTVTREMLRTIFDTMDINKDGSLQLSEAIIGLRETPGLDEGMISSWVRRLYYNPRTISFFYCDGLFSSVITNNEILSF